MNMINKIRAFVKIYNTQRILVINKNEKMDNKVIVIYSDRLNEDNRHWIKTSRSFYYKYIKYGKY